MKRSVDRILTTHVGRLERPDELTAPMDAYPDRRPTDAAFATLLRESVREVVRRQADAGLDVVNDGEFGKISWFVYLRSRLGGFEVTDEKIAVPVGQDRLRFDEFYAWAESQSRSLYYRSPGGDRFERQLLVCSGQVRYTGHAAVQEDIANLNAAAAEAGVEEAFMPATAPGSVFWENRYYDTAEEYLFALAEALREEYRAIVDGGLILQVDDPSIPALWDWVSNGDADAYHRSCELRIEALNHALTGIPPDRVRVHLCWGAWHGPHSTDVPLKMVAPLLLKMNVGGYAFEAGNVRHEHEWEVWRDVDLPDDRVLIPGVISHATNVLEHPELVAQRLRNFASVVGRERVIGGTDCGLGYRVHPQIAWAKLEALAQGAELATRALWR